MDKDNALQEFWNVYSEILLTRGCDLGAALKQWAGEQEVELPGPGARDDFKELRESGCVPEILAILLAALRWSPKFEDFWSKFCGSPTDRRRVRNKLEKTAKAMEGLFELLIQLEDDDVTSKLSKIDRIGPGRVVSELRFYARFLNLTESISRETQTRSLADFCKFALTQYVKQATGRFRDRNVSGLIVEAIGTIDYNEVAHRMWRLRNFKRIGSHFKEISELLAAIHTLANSKT
jgi:hypothetical protein